MHFLHRLMQSLGLRPCFFETRRPPSRIDIIAYQHVAGRDQLLRAEQQPSPREAPPVVAPAHYRRAEQVRRMPFLADRQWMRRRFEPDHSALREFLYPDPRHEVISAVARKLHYFSLGVLHFFLPSFFVHLSHSIFINSTAREPSRLATRALSGRWGGRRTAAREYRRHHIGVAERHVDGRIRGNRPAREPRDNPVDRIQRIIDTRRVRRPTARISH